MIPIDLYNVKQTLIGTSNTLCFLLPSIGSLLVPLSTLVCDSVKILLAGHFSLVLIDTR